MSKREGWQPRPETWNLPDMEFSDLLFAVGLFLVLLGAASAVYLLLFALGRLEKAKGDLNIATLWGLFMGGLTIGMLLTWAGWPS